MELHLHHRRHLKILARVSTHCNAQAGFELTTLCCISTQPPPRLEAASGPHWVIAQLQAIVIVCKSTPPPQSSTLAACQARHWTPSRAAPAPAAGTLWTGTFKDVGPVMYKDMMTALKSYWACMRVGQHFVI